MSGCPKKPKVVTQPVQQQPQPEKEAGTPPEPSIRGAEFRSAPELKTVYFDYDKYAISEESRKTLESDSGYLKRNSGLEVLVEGNTCECGTNDYNLALGQKRAAAVRDYIINLGVPGEKIGTISFGEEKPANKNAGPPDSPRCSANRRAELKIRETAPPSPEP